MGDNLKKAIADARAVIALQGGDAYSGIRVIQSHAGNGGLMGFELQYSLPATAPEGIADNSTDPAATIAQASS